MYSVVEMRSLYSCASFKYNYYQASNKWILIPSQISGFRLLIYREHLLQTEPSLVLLGLLKRVAWNCSQWWLKELGKVSGKDNRELIIDSNCKDDGQPER